MIIASKKHGSFNFGKESKFLRILSIAARAEAILQACEPEPRASVCEPQKISAKKSKYP